jgi:hypothetical protein
MIRNTLLAIVFTIIIIAVNLHSEVVHIPLFFVFIAATKRLDVRHTVGNKHFCGVLFEQILGINANKIYRFSIHNLHFTFAVFIWRFYGKLFQQSNQSK